MSHTSAVRDTSVTIKELGEALNILVALIVKGGSTFGSLERVQITIKAQPELLGCALIVSQKPDRSIPRVAGVPREKMKYVSEFIGEQAGALQELFQRHTHLIKEAFDKAKVILSASNMQGPEGADGSGLDSLS